MSQKPTTPTTTATTPILNKREYAQKMVDANPKLFPSRTAAEEAISTFFDVMEDALQAGQGVRFVGRMAVTLERKPARKVTFRNFSEGKMQVVEKPAETRPRIAISKSWRDRMTVVDKAKTTPKKASTQKSKVKGKATPKKKG